MTVNDVETRMTEREIASWFKFDCQRPLPDVADDIHNAMICTLIVSVMKSPDSPAVDPRDFYLYKTEAPPPEEPPPTTERSIADAFKLASGG